MMDSTLVGAPPCAAGAPAAHGGQASQALGRRRGGFTTKIQVSGDAQGNPLRIRLTPGHRHASTQAPDLTDGVDYDHLIADRSYDANKFLTRVAAQQASPVSPPPAKRRVQPDYDRALHRERPVIECCINKIKP